MNHLPDGFYVSKNSSVHRLDETVKVLSLAVLVAAVVMTNSLYGYLVLFLFAASVCFLSKLGFHAAFGNILRLRWFFIIIFLMNLCFFKAENAWISLWVFNPSYDGLMQGIKVVTRVVAFMIFSNIVNATTPPARLTSAIENIIFPLRLFRVPVQQIALILSVSVQFIPILFEEADVIKKAQTARGSELESKNYFKKATAIVPLVVPIFISAFRRADELSLAMEARGYRVDAKFGGSRKVHIGMNEIVSFVLCCVLLVVQIAVF